MNSMIKINGINRQVFDPDYSGVSVGISPDGAGDAFSYSIGRSLFENFTCFEVFGKANIEVIETCNLFVTGARNTIDDGLSNYVTNLVYKGHTIQLENPNKGFRRYIFVLPKEQHHFDLKQFMRVDEIFAWQHSRELVAHEGIDIDCIDKELLGTCKFVVRDVTPQAIKIEPTMDIKVSYKEITSCAVDIGVVQMSPQGFFALSSQRQTVGGYPRVFTFGESEMHTMAQFKVGQIFKVRLTTWDEIDSISKSQKSILQKIKELVN